MPILVNSPAGKWTNPSVLDQLPPGAMLEAENLVFRRPGIAETRPGFELAPTAFPTVSTIRSATTFNGYLIAWFVLGKIARYQLPNGPWTLYAGTYPAPYGTNRVHWMESNGVLFVTTGTAVYRLDSVTSEFVLSGVQPASETTATLTGASGFLGNNTAVAYKAVWGRTDARGTLLLGEPSPRFIVTNAAGGSRNVTLRTYIPQTVDTNHFLQLYRTSQSPLLIDPGESLSQVYEIFPTAQNVANGYIDVLDQVPDELRGAALYTSPEIGELPNSRPPLAGDIVQVGGYTIYARARGISVIQVTLLGAGVEPGIVNGEGLRINTLSFQLIATGAGVENAAIGQFKIETALTPSQNVAETAKSMARVIAIAGRSGDISARYVGDDVSIGTIEIYTTSASSELRVGAWGSGDHFVPALPGELRGTGTLVANVVTVTTATPHGLVVGQSVKIDGPFAPWTSAGYRTVASTPTTTTFTYPEVYPDTATPLVIVLYNTGADGLPQMAVVPLGGDNVFAHSAFERPDAVPVVNLTPVGSVGTPILRAIKVGLAVYFLKPEGLFRLSGSSPESWVLTPWDETVTFIAMEAVTVAESTAYALTTEGVVRWTENTKPEPASLPVESEIRSLVTLARSAVSAYAWMCVDDRTREVLLGTAVAPGDTSSTVIYVYNYGTGAWATWPLASYNGHVSPGDDKLYIERPSTSELYRSRISGTADDYQDPGPVAVVSKATFMPQSGETPALEKLWSEVEFLFHGSAPTSATARFSSEQAPAEVNVPCETVGTTLPVGSAWAAPDDEHARACSITVGITHSVLNESLTLVGYSITNGAPYQSRR